MQRELLGRLTGDRRGAVAVTFALSLTLLVGAAGLGTEVAIWYMDKRRAQGAADTAAYSALVASRAGETADFADTAKAIAAQYGFTDGRGAVSVAINHPPRSGSYRGDNNAIEIIIKAPQLPLFSKLFDAAPTIAARAVALDSDRGGVRVVE